MARAAVDRDAVCLSRLPACYSYSVSHTVGSTVSNAVSHTVGNTVSNTVCGFNDRT